MSNIRDIHRLAMQHTDLALEARLKGLEADAVSHFQNAYSLEIQAANLVADDLSAEPTRSVLLRSAASLALDCNLPLEAEKLVCRALSGNPPSDIAEELRDLLEQINFRRHLDLKSISLDAQEVQMSIAGKGVGYGIAPTDAFLGRVEKTESILYRIAERRQNKPYRERGRRDKALSESLKLYMTVPRAASFAVTFRVGKGEQLAIPGLSFEEDVIDELLACLEHFTRHEEDKLRERIPDEAYYRNFVGLAQGIAPDGGDVNLVGFTASRSGSLRTVQLTSTSPAISSTAVAGSVIPEPSQQRERLVSVSGVLKMADARKATVQEIQIVDAGNVAHTIVVPLGMMSDIVKPLWGTDVIITGTMKGKKINLQDIHPDNQSSESKATSQG